MPRFNYADRHPNVNWRDNSIQFPRLISELQAAGALDDRDMMDALCLSMDLTEEQVFEIVGRADKQWEAIKAATCPGKKRR